MSNKTPADSATKNPPKDNQEFTIQKIYLKDVSFESPNSPKAFRNETWQPQINVQLNSTNEKLEDSIYEVVLTITVTAKHESDIVFLVEIKQAGIFTITGFPADSMGGMLGAFCPETLFPYAREAVSELVTKGGFPQMLLSPVNFNAMYNQQVEQAKQQAKH